MTVRMSAANGDFTTAGTWQAIDATSYLNAEAGPETITTAYSGTRSSAFTPGAIEIDGIAVKLGSRSGTTGTISVNLELDSDNSQVAGTEVTIDCADLPVAVAADLNGGWVFFKLAAPVTLAAATAYQVAAKTSSSGQISLFRDGTTDNIARALRTTTTGAPGAGDDLIVCGEYTGQGTSNSFTVTMDNTAATDFGAAATSLVTPALAICSKGVLTYGTTAATNYYLKLSGNVIIYSGGIFNIGTTGTPIPRDSTAVLEFDIATNVEYGLVNRNLGTFVPQGLSRTSGKDIVKCLLNTDEAANQTTLGVDTDTGWLDNDEIAIASTTRTRTECEKGTLNGNAGASSLTVDGFAGAGGGLAFAHSGSAPLPAEVILLTRNVKIRGTSATLQAYMTFATNSTTDMDWVECYFMGSGTGNKRGLDVQLLSTGTGAFNADNCSLHDFVVTSSVGFNGSTGAISLTNNVTYNIHSEHIVLGTAGSTQVCTGNTCILSVGTTAAMINISSINSFQTITDNTVAGSANTAATTAAFFISGTRTSVTGTFSGNYAHSNALYGFNFRALTGGTIGAITSRRNAGTGVVVSHGSGDLTFSSMTSVGNGTASFTSNGNPGTTEPGLAGIIRFTSPVFDGEASFTTPSGIVVTGTGTTGGTIFIESGSLGAVEGHSTADVTAAIAGEWLQLTAHNTLFSSSTEVSGQENLTAGSFISSQKHDQTDGNHKTWRPYGTLTIDTTADMFDVTPSERMTPNNASNKLESSSFFAAVADGETATVSVKVRESVVGDGTDYNGNRPRLIVKKNVAAGIAADAVLDTATASAEGAFETLSGTTAAVGDDCILEFIVDCDGTTGWVNVDTWGAPTAASTLGVQYWKDGNFFAYGNNSTGGGSGGMIQSRVLTGM